MIFGFMVLNFDKMYVEFIKSELCVVMCVYLDILVSYIILLGFYRVLILIW